LCHRLIAVLFVVLSVSRVGHSGEGENKIAARNFYLEGRRLYDVGEYRASLDSFKKAYLRYEDSSFLFNIGQCHRQLGQKQEALQAYRSYLRRTPEAENRPEVQRLIVQLESLITEETARKSAPVPAANVAPTRPGPAFAEPATRASAPPSAAPDSSQPNAAAVQKKPLYKRWWLWTTVVGVAAAGAAVGVGVYYGTHRFDSTLPGFSSGSALTVGF
jgi:tetratricopeptide (TPR) repeat protein